MLRLRKTSLNTNILQYLHLIQVKWNIKCFSVGIGASVEAKPHKVER